MKEYAVIFHPAYVNEIGNNVCGNVHKYNTLKEARAYSRWYTNSNIYRIEWTENGLCYTRKLKTFCRKEG